MPQSKWERGFWASVRGGGTGIFKPYPPEHWRKPKTNRKRKVKKRAKSYFLKNHVKVISIPDTFFNSF